MLAVGLIDTAEDAKRLVPLLDGKLEVDLFFVPPFFPPVPPLRFSFFVVSG